MTRKLVTHVSILFLVSLLAACASSAPQPAERSQPDRQGADEDPYERRDDRRDAEEDLIDLRDDRDRDRDRDRDEDRDRDRDRDEDRDRDRQSAECYKADEFICEIEAAIVEQTNALRAGELGSSQDLKHSAKLSWSARSWSESQEARGFIGHFGFPWARAREFAEEFGFEARMSAENVAYTSVGGDDPESIAQAFTNMWWNSSGHKRNMLGRHEQIGVGVVRDGRTYYATQIFGRE